MKGLCKTKDDTIPVFTFKSEEANRRTNASSSYRLKFKKLVMKVIRSQRIEDDNSEEEEGLLLNNFGVQEVQKHSHNDSYHS